MNTPAAISNSIDLDSLIRLAQNGHCPLFHQDWLRESLKTDLNDRRLTLARAKRVVDETLKKLERHKSLERKQIVLSSLDDLERNDFIRSFYKVMECKTLDEIKELH